MEFPDIDRLAFITASGSQSAVLLHQLTQADFHYTIVDSTSALAGDTETRVLVGFHSVRLPHLLELVRAACHSYRQYIPAQGFLSGDVASQPMVEAQMGGALFYLMEVEHFEQI